MKVTLCFAALVAWALLLASHGRQEKIAEPKPHLPPSTSAQQLPPKESAPGEAVVVGAPPKIVVDNAVHDFGDIEPGSKNTCKFNFSNQGRGVLEITKVQSTCGCTVPELKKKTYLPGESGTINVTYHASPHGGHVSKSLYILSNDKSNPKAKLSIKARIIEKVTYEPKRFTMMPKEKNAGVGEIKITSVDGKSFAISHIDIKPACMTINYDPATEANEFVLHPQVVMDKLEELRNGTITITLTHPSVKTILIPFDMLPPFRADPATLIALNAEPGKPIQKTIYILSNYGEDFEVESVSVSNDAIKIVSEEKTADKYIIVVDIVPPKDIGNKRYFNSKLTVHIAGGETLRINCVGRVSPKGAKNE
jgi:hypothetical protein